jgi:hypothetical protein
MTKKLAFIALLAIAAIACKKEEDSENPEITIFTPTTNQEFESADSVQLNFKVEDEDLHEVGFTIVEEGTTDTLYYKAASHTHDSPYVLNKKYFISVDAHTDATLIVNAEDHNGNKASKSVNFHIHPM